MVAPRWLVCRELPAWTGRISALAALSCAVPVLPPASGSFETFLDQGNVPALSLPLLLASLLGTSFVYHHFVEMRQAASSLPAQC